MFLIFSILNVSFMFRNWIDFELVSSFFWKGKNNWIIYTIERHDNISKNMSLAWQDMLLHILSTRPVQHSVYIWRTPCLHMMYTWSAHGRGIILSSLFNFWYFLLFLMFFHTFGSCFPYVLHVLVWLLQWSRLQLGRACVKM